MANFLRPFEKLGCRRCRFRPYWLYSRVSAKYWGWKFTLHPLFRRLWLYTVIVLALEKIILQMNFPVHYQTLNASLEGRDFAIFKVLFTIENLFPVTFFWWVVKPTQPEKLDTFKRHKQLLYCFGNKSNLTDNLVELWV